MHYLCILFVYYLCIICVLFVYYLCIGSIQIETCPNVWLSLVMLKFSLYR
jgi:hypothetical protein